MPLVEPFRRFRLARGWIKGALWKAVLVAYGVHGLSSVICEVHQFIYSSGMSSKHSSEHFSIDGVTVPPNASDASKAWMIKQ